MTQEAVANEVGCDAGNISRVEMGKQSASIERLTKIARAMQVRVSDLFIMIETTPTETERQLRESEISRYDEDMQSLRRAYIALDPQHRAIALDMVRSLIKNQRKKAAEAANRG